MTDHIFYKRILDDGRVIEVVALTYGRARLYIGDGTLTFTDGW